MHSKNQRNLIYCVGEWKTSNHSLRVILKCLPRHAVSHCSNFEPWPAQVSRYFNSSQLFRSLLLSLRNEDATFDQQSEDLQNGKICKESAKSSESNLLYHSHQVMTVIECMVSMVVSCALTTTEDSIYLIKRTKFAIDLEA